MIKTERLELIFFNLMHLEALSRGENEFAGLMGCGLAGEWQRFPEATPYAIEMLRGDPQAIRWGMMMMYHPEDDLIIGTCGFKGTPDGDGMVEIGYAIAPAYEGKGLSSEAAEGMTKYAFEWAAVRCVDAHTLAEWNASTRILQKCGFTKIAEKHDDEDGDIWQWRLERSEFESRKGEDG